MANDMSKHATSAPSLSSGSHYVIDRMLFAVNEEHLQCLNTQMFPTYALKKCLKIDCTTDASLTSDAVNTL